MRYGIYILLLLVLAACQSKEPGRETYQKEIAEIDEHITSLNKVLKDFNQLDSNKIFSIHSEYEEMKRILTSYYKVDSIEPVFATRVNMFKSLKSTKDYQHNRRLYVKEANYTLSQLNDLKGVLLQESINEEDVPEAMRLEIKGATTIISVMSSYNTMLKSQLVMYDTLNPHIQSVVDSLKHMNHIE